MKNLFLVPALIIVVLANSCAPSSVISPEGAVGGLLGSAVGGGVGAFFAQDYGHQTENILINGAIGAGAGLAAGALVHEIRMESANEKARIVRQAEMIGEAQREIDLLRQEMADASTWGRGEVKPWEDRYMGDNPDLPYQGISP